MIDPRVPPHDREAERCVLGSILRDNACLPDVSVVLSPTTFYLDAHQKLFAAMLALSDEGKPVDLVILADRIKTLGQLEDVGGYEYLATLLDAAPTSMHAMHYAKIIHDKFTLREVILACNELLRDAATGEAPADEILSQFQLRAISLGDNRPTTDARKLKHFVDEALNRIDERVRERGRVQNPATGLVDLDFMLTDFRPGEMVIVAARPSVGKTAFALQILKNAATNGFPGAFVSLEQSGIELGERMLCGEAGVNSGSVRSGRGLEQSDIEALVNARNELAKLNVFVLENPGMRVREIAAAMRRLKIREKLGFVAIDYLQLITAADGKVNRTEQVSQMTRSLKLMARGLQVPVLLLSQLNRAPANENREPRLSDLRDSGSIEQDADTVIILHRENAEPNPMEPVENVKCIVAKQRNGPTGSVGLFYRKATFTFENAAPGEVAG